MFGILAACCAVRSAAAAEMQELTDAYGPFGPLHIYRTSDHPSHVVLFVSGDGGWKLGVVDMAKALAEMDSMVVGIDITRYIADLNKSSDHCNYAAAHLEGLSQYLQKKFGFAHYVQPILVGYSSGASAVFTTLAQSPDNTFSGGISLSFCPDLKTTKPFCKGSGELASTADPKLGFIYQPTAKLPSPWIVLQGEIDEVCSSRDTEAFVTQVGQGELVALPKVGHGFSVEANWMPQLKTAYLQLSGNRQTAWMAAPKGNSMSDLPLVELPVTRKSDVAAIIVSGDGGWASIDKQLGEALNRDGIPIVGLNALQYFWEKKSPDIAGRDLARILAHYSKAWNIERFILVGYSRGADTLPFMVSRLPDELKARVTTVVLLGLDGTVDFEFHVADRLSSRNAGAQEVLPEVRKITSLNVLCVYGADERDSGCRKLDPSVARVVEMKGGHHFAGEYQKLAALILEHSKR